MMVDHSTVIATEKGLVGPLILDGLREVTPGLKLPGSRKDSPDLVD